MAALQPALSWDVLHHVYERACKLRLHSIAPCPPKDYYSALKAVIIIVITINLGGASLCVIVNRGEADMARLEGPTGN